MILENRAARFNYEITETFEAGLVLQGWEVKSIRAKNANLKPAWVKVRDGELFLENFAISPWKFSQEEQTKDRPKKLLLHKKEIERIESKIAEKGLSVVPIKIFLHKGKIKCMIGVGKGRKQYQKKQVLKERTLQKEAEKVLKQY